MSKQHHIISRCTIREGAVYKDGQLLFKKEGESLADLLVAVYHFLNPDYPKFYKMDPLSKLGWLAAEFLLKEVPVPGEKEDISIVLSNSNASLDTDIRYFATIDDIPSPGLFVYTLPNIMIGEISIRHGFKGENAFFISDRYDPDLLEQYVSGLLDTGATTTCICGWVDVLEDCYRAELFLVTTGASGILFTAANMNKDDV